MERIIKLKLLNNHITCKICRGYLVDATTVTECLHTFCKCCLVKHLEDNNTCPTCKIIIHQSHPLQYISYDRTMQDIVFKLVPNLEQNELKREREFYQKRNLPNPKDVNNTSSVTATNSNNVVSHSAAAATAIVTGNNMTSTQLHQQSPQSLTSQTNDYHRKDEQVNICLDTANMGSLKALQRRFLRLSAQATIMHLKKFVAKKVLNDMDKCHEIDIYCNNELLGKDHTLKFVYVTRWRFQNSPLILQYRPKLIL